MNEECARRLQQPFGWDVSDAAQVRAPSKRICHRRTPPVVTDGLTGRVTVINRLTDPEAPFKYVRGKTIP